MLTDRGTEFCGSDRHEYALYPAVEESTTPEPRPGAGRPTTCPHEGGGICERFHRILLDEFYRVTFRKKIYRTIDEPQTDLDAWIGAYNEKWRQLST